MDDITSRTIIIAVNIFVTITIITMLILTFTKMSDIYGIVGTTNNSIYERFNDVYSMYDGKIENGMGLLNTLKKYEDDRENAVIVEYINKENILEDIVDKEKTEASFLKEIMEANENGKNERYKRNLL